MTPVDNYCVIDRKHHKSVFMYLTDALVDACREEVNSKSTDQKWRRVVLQHVAAAAYQRGVKIDYSLDYADLVFVELEPKEQPKPPLRSRWKKFWYGH